SWWGGSRSFLFGGSEEEMQREIAQFSVHDAERYSAFCAASRRIYEDAILTAGNQPFTRLIDFLRLLPRMLQLDALRSVNSFIERFFQDPRVQQAFSFHPLFIGGDPFRVPAVYAALAYLQLAGGVWYTPGGVYSVIQALEEVIRSGGGEIITGCQVTEILRGGDRVCGVRLAGAEELPAEIVISNVDGAQTRAMAGLAPRRQRMSMSSFLLYFGVDRKFPSLHHHNLLVGPDYRGFIRQVTKLRQLPETTCLYLHAPSRTDSTMAPAGGESISVLLPVPNLQGPASWPEAGDELRDRVLDAFESVEGLGLQGFRKSIVLERRWTPLDFRDQLGAEAGNAFGPEPLLWQSAYFRQPNRYCSPRGLYQVGAHTHPGAGIPGVLLTAKVTADLITG
ncbi:MAG: phytoene desaturase family protein, partial [Candidatus Dormibacteraceae bacterium]